MLNEAKFISDEIFINEKQSFFLSFLNAPGNFTIKKNICKHNSLNWNEWKK